VTDTGNSRVQQFALAAPPASGCVPLGPLGSPPPPKLPTLPAPDGPQVSLRVLRSTGLLTRRSVPFRVGCDTRCTVEASVTITPRAKPRRGAKRVSVVLQGEATIAAGETALLRLRLSDGEVRGLRRALRGRRGLTANVQATATADVGTPTTVIQRVSPTA
jgi:hypothetical protein